MIEKGVTDIILNLGLDQRVGLVIDQDRVLVPIQDQKGKKSNIVPISDISLIIFFPE